MDKERLEKIYDYICERIMQSGSADDIKTLAEALMIIESIRNRMLGN